MSSVIIIQVLVPLLFLNLFASAQMYGYPQYSAQPYPYMQQYPNYGGDINNFGVQGSPQYSQSYPYPYQPVYPGSYAPQFSSYPAYPSFSPVSYPGSVPQGYPDQSQFPISGLPQYPLGTNVYPSHYPVPIPKSISTPYGNIPVEIIDVDGSIERQVGLIGGTSFNATEENTKLMPVLTESKSMMDVLSNPTKTTKIVAMDPTQTKIVRTLDPQGGKIHVEVQTNKPVSTKEKDTSNEENNDTTTKTWLFG